MRTIFRVMGVLVVGSIGLVTLGWCGVADAQVEPSSQRTRDPVVAITGDVVVPEGQTVEAVVLVNGDVQIAGRVRESVFVVNGDVVVTGTVDDTVVALNGRITVDDGALVGGDVVSSEPPRIASGATVEGDVEDLDVGALTGAFWLILGIVFWIALTVSTLVLGLVLLLFLGRRGADALDETGRTQVGLSIAWGIGLTFGLPIAGVILIATIVGLPLGIALLFALALVHGLGYVVGALFLGRLILRPTSNPFLAFLLGWGILRVVELVPFVGGLVGLAATVYGLGILSAALWRLRSSGEAAARTVPATEAATLPPPPQG